MANVKPISKFITPIFFISWIFGVGVMEYPSGKLHPVFSFIYSSACITGYCILAGVISSDFLTKAPIPSVTTPVKILFFSHIVLTVSIISMGWYRSKVKEIAVNQLALQFFQTFIFLQALRASIQKISFADNMMEHIGIEKNYLKLFKIELKKGILSFALTVTVTTINSSVAFVEKLPLHTKIFTAIVMSYPVFIMFIADITFMSIIRKVFYQPNFTKLNLMSKRG